MSENIFIKNLTVHRGSFQLGPLSMKITKGEYVVILGPNGAGKTLFMETLCGLREASKGEVMFEGDSLLEQLPSQRGMGYVPQDLALFEHMTVRDNIGFALRERGDPPLQIERETNELAQWLEIKQLLDRKPGTLSGGQKQRVALARALGSKPRCLILDEPTSALDEFSREEIGLELKKIHRKSGATTFHVCHRFAEASMVADKIWIVNKGRMVQSGSAAELYRNPKTAFVANFIRAGNVWEGKVKSQSGKTWIQCGNLEIPWISIDQPCVSLLIPWDGIKMGGTGYSIGEREIEELWEVGTSVRIQWVGEPVLQSEISKEECAKCKLSRGKVMPLQLALDQVQILEPSS